MKVSIVNLGCKVNKYESDSLMTEFQNNGFEVVNKNEKADIVVVNTCTVTNIADRKSRQMIRRAKKNGSIVICTGCLAESEKDLKEKINDIDILIDNNNKINLVDTVISYLNGDKDIDIENNNNSNSNYGEFKCISYIDRSRAVLKIQDGCNMFCSYCIIPYVRGRIRSRSKENILKEANEIAESGIKEIVLTGIHVASYGKEDKENNYFLIDLLEDLDKVDGIERIRISSIEPGIITEDFLNRLKKLNSICHHFHLSMQSANNVILKKMNRKYTIEEFMKKVQMIRNTFKDANITTDIITGFPNETEELFKETYNNVDKINFLRTHVFPYSERKGTVAAKMDNQVDMHERKKRASIMIKLSEKHNLEILKKLKENNNYGRGFSVLIEEEKDGKYYGYSRNYVRCEIDKNIADEKIKETIYLNELSENKENSNNKSKFTIKNNYSSNIGKIIKVDAKRVIEVNKNIEEYIMECE